MSDAFEHSIDEDRQLEKLSAIMDPASARKVLGIISDVEPIAPKLDYADKYKDGLPEAWEILGSSTYPVGSGRMAAMAMSKAIGDKDNKQRDELLKQLRNSNSEAIVDDKVA